MANLGDYMLNVAILDIEMLSQECKPEHLYAVIKPTGEFIVTLGVQVNEMQLKPIHVFVDKDMKASVL